MKVNTRCYRDLNTHKWYGHNRTTTLWYKFEVYFKSFSFNFFPLGLLSYLVKQHHIITASKTYCSIRLLSKTSLSFSSTYFILVMTFERFYSIIRPHKASSFNTVRKARITCFCILMLCILYNIPQVFLYKIKGYSCVQYAENMDTLGTLYYGLSLILDFAFPFVALLTMNSVIIHTIRTREFLSATKQSDKTCQTHDKQIFIILLLVSFSFLILTSPSYILFLLNLIIDFNQVVPKYQAANRLFHSITQKLDCTNNGINFFLYILSGRKFRNDLVQVVQCNRKNANFTVRSNVGTSSDVYVRKNIKSNFSFYGWCNRTISYVVLLLSSEGEFVHTFTTIELCTTILYFMQFSMTRKIYQ